MTHAPVMKSYTVRNWISSYVRMVNGERVEHVVYSGHNTQESAERCASRVAARYGDVVAIKATPVDHVHEYEYGGEGVYDGYQWHLDGTFSAKPGQEVTREIYDDMFDCLPSISLPRLPETQGFAAGFLVGEPYDHVNGKAIYSAFAQRDGRCFFLGYLPAR